MTRKKDAALAQPVNADKWERQAEKAAPPNNPAALQDGHQE